jgi:hypothetical protein
MSQHAKKLVNWVKVCYCSSMGKQTKETNSVSTTHGKAKNAANKGFFKAFAQKGGLESPGLLTAKDQVKGVGNTKVNRPYPLAQRGKKIGAGLKSAEPFTTITIPNNYRKESK